MLYAVGQFTGSYKVILDDLIQSNSLFCCRDLLNSLSYYESSPFNGENF